MARKRGNRPTTGKNGENRELTQFQKSMLKEANRLITLRSDGRSQEVSLSEAVIRRLFQVATNGSPHALGHVLRNLNDAQALNQALIREKMAEGERIKQRLRVRGTLRAAGLYHRLVAGPSYRPLQLASDDEARRQNTCRRRKDDAIARKKSARDKVQNYRNRKRSKPRRQVQHVVYVTPVSRLPPCISRCPAHDRGLCYRKAGKKLSHFSGTYDGGSNRR